MIAEEYRYIKGSRDRSESVELDVATNDGMYITTCNIYAHFLACGNRLFPCENGDNLKLDTEQRLKVLEFVQAERKKITDSYPVKTYKGWHESGLRIFEEYCFPGDKVDEAVVDHFVNSVPPTTFRDGYVQAGEPYSRELDDNDVWKNTYVTFSYYGKDDAGNALWLYNGCCFKNETDNKARVETSIEVQIEAVRMEISKND